MTELEFSLIGEPTPTLRSLLKTFEAEQRVHVRLRLLDWEKAWPELLTYALYDRGPDVAHVGSTWGGSLVAMNSLRNFTQQEIRTMGGAEAFLPQAWQSGWMPDRSEVWSLPWAAYTFLLCYRRDLLHQAGVDEEGAFADSEALAKTLGQLRAAGVETPWVVPVDPSFVDVLHHVASWVWGAGGDFISMDGQSSLLLQANTLNGLRSYLDLLRFMQPLFVHLDELAAQQIFARGGAGATILGSGTLYSMVMDQEAASEVLDNLGVVPVPGVPWIGGDNLVVWKHTQGYPERERAALALVRFLTSRAAQQASAQGEDVMLPTRPDAIGALPLSGSLLTQAVLRSLQTGRAYHSVAMWSRIETQLSSALGRIGEEILAGLDTEQALQKHLEPLARRLEVTLSS